MKREIRGSIDIRVEFRDVDMLRVAHNSVYFLWFERGRLALLESIIPFQTALDQGIALIVVRQECQYHAPALLGDDLILTTRTELTDAYSGRIRFTHALSNRRTLIEIATGETDLTMWNIESRKLIRDVPDLIRDRIRDLILGAVL